jgi:hypothetical protein
MRVQTSVTRPVAAPLAQAQNRFAFWATMMAVSLLAVLSVPQTAAGLPTSPELGGRMAAECALDGADTDRASWDACCAHYASNCIRNCEGMGNSSGTCTDLCNSALSECMDSYREESITLPTLPTRPQAPSSPGIVLEPKGNDDPELQLLLK